MTYMKTWRILTITWTSDYPPEHPNYDKTNKKVLGKFKDEMNGKIITHFIGLKPKAYCYKVYGDDKRT